MVNLFLEVYRVAAAPEPGGPGDRHRSAANWSTPSAQCNGAVADRGPQAGLPSGKGFIVIEVAACFLYSLGSLISWIIATCQLLFQIEGKGVR